ncbi:potassium channel subfamily K member 10-like isoform X2 [Eriocheir sinensis]|uniref:potassium channel subfamily K member 10-like isoform X2 n=1 Tax=Eriocheir sinensis TaxID=95602 RepID=UPI0021C7F126|nr:potassium channel subfamily K member 10-like isoform X2 [Eriocheir sinensis]
MKDSPAMEHHKGRRISIRSMKKEAERVRASSYWRCGMSKGTFSGVKVTVLWVTYVLLGSLAFQYIEETTYTTESMREHHHWARFKELASGQHVVEELLALRESLLEICPTPHMNRTFELLSEDAAGEAMERNKTLMEHVDMGQVEEGCGPALLIMEHLTKKETWSLVDAIYYTMTAVTTIGYGHIHPKTPPGRLFCVLYCLVGVPLTCILLAKSTDLLSSRMHRLYTTAKRRHQSQGRSMLYLVTTVYLSVGFLVFMLLPSIALTKLESWTLEESLYLTFITLTTIGFGDLYPGYDDEAPYKDYQDLYKMIIVIYIMVALGYWFLLLNFLQKVLRKNVPQRIKKTIRQSKRYTKQSEFFRQLVSKVMSEQDEVQQQAKPVVGGAGGANSRGVVALMVEVADALADDTRRPSLAVAVPGGQHSRLRRESCRSNAPLTLEQLLEVRVAVRGEAVPHIQSFVASSPHPSSGALQDFLEGNETPRRQEVTLPLREVLTLVTLIKSVQDEVGDGNRGDDSGTSSSTPSSPISTVTSLDPQDYVPLIRSCRNHDVLHEADPDEDEDEDEDEDDLDEEEEEEEDEEEKDPEKGKRGARFMIR